MVLALTLAGSAGAQDAPASPQPEATPAPEARLHLGGFVDGVFAYNFNRPADHANFLPGLGTSAKRDNEVTINLAQVDLVLAPEPVGFKLSLGFGTAPEVVHAAEVRGAATSPDVWRNVVQASVQWQTKVGRGLLLEAGIYPSHIGFEGFAPKDNWNYTRSWLGELSPYYQAGAQGRLPVQRPLVRAAPPPERLAGDRRQQPRQERRRAARLQRGQVLRLVQRHRRAGAGRQRRRFRMLGDVVATWKATPSLSLGVSMDAAREGRPAGDDVGWWGIGLYARFAPPSSRTALRPARRVLRRRGRRHLRDRPDAEGGHRDPGPT